MQLPGDAGPLLGDRRRRVLGAGALGRARPGRRAPRSPAAVTGPIGPRPTEAGEDEPGRQHLVDGARRPAAAARRPEERRGDRDAPDQRGPPVRVRAEGVDGQAAGRTTARPTRRRVRAAASRRPGTAAGRAAAGTGGRTAARWRRRASSACTGRSWATAADVRRPDDRPGRTRRARPRRPRRRRVPAGASPCGDGSERGGPRIPRRGRPRPPLGDPLARPADDGDARRGEASERAARGGAHTSEERTWTARTGRHTAAIGGGLLLAASVGAELVHPVQAPDGDVLERGLWVGLPRRVRGGRRPPGCARRRARPGRRGRRGSAGPWTSPAPRWCWSPACSC